MSEGREPPDEPQGRPGGTAPGGPFGRRGPAVQPGADGLDAAAGPPTAGIRPGPPAPPRTTASATWILGIAVVLGVAYITLNTIRTDEPGSRGIAPGRALPPFAAPLAASGADNDANVATRAQGGARPACEVRGRQILNSCELAERGPVVLAFVAVRSRRCVEQIDALDRLRSRFPDVGFAAVAIRGDRSELRALVRRRGWGLPVGHDRDGAVANVYAVAVCPTITFAREGGIVDSTTLGYVEGSEIARRVEAMRR